MHTLIDILDSLHGKATPGQWFIGNACDDEVCAVVQSEASSNICMFSADHHDRYAPDQECIVALHNAWPAISRALRAAQAFKDGQAWACREWKEQPHVAALFEALAGLEQP